MTRIKRLRQVQMNAGSTALSFACVVALFCAVAEGQSPSAAGSAVQHVASAPIDAPAQGQGFAGATGQQTPPATSSATIPAGTRLPSAVARGADVVVPIDGATSTDHLKITLSDGRLPTDVVPLLEGKNLHFTLPPALKGGRYTLQLFVNDDPPLTVPGELRVAEDESVTPVIGNISTPVYPSNALSMSDARIADFTIIGEHFGNDRDTQVQIAGHDPLLACRSQHKGPCIVVGPTSVVVHGFLPLPFEGPTKVSVQVGNLASEARDVTFSMFGIWWLRGLACAGTVVIAFLVFVLIRSGMAQYHVNGKQLGVLKLLVIDKDTNTYSLSKLQILLWTSASVFGYVYFFLCHLFIQWKADFPDVPDGIPVLLGLSVGTSVVVGGLTTRTKGAGPESPTFADFISSGGVVMPERFQFFVWTVVGLAGFVSVVLSTDPARLAALPSIPTNFLMLMGVSSAGYLAGKLVRNPGPVITRAVVSRATEAGSWSVCVDGQNLEANAVLRIGDHAFVADISKQGGMPTTQNRYRPRLEWTIPAPKLSIADPPNLEVTNADGQSATVRFEAPAVEQRAVAVVSSRPGLNAGSSSIDPTATPLSQEHATRPDSSSQAVTASAPSQLGAFHFQSRQAQGLRPALDLPPRLACDYSRSVTCHTAPTK